MSRFPAASRSESKTIVRPFGDQLGFSPPMFAAFVSCVWPVPSAFITHTCRRPLRSLMNAMRVPSGDHAGSASSAALVVRRVSPVPSELIE